MNIIKSVLLASGALVAILALTAGVEAGKRSGLFLNRPSLDGVAHPAPSPLIGLPAGYELGSIVRTGGTGSGGSASGGTDPD